MECEVWHQPWTTPTSGGQEATGVELERNPEACGAPEAEEEVLPEDGVKDHLGESKLKEAENRALAGVMGKGLVVPAGAGVGTKGGQPRPRGRRT